MRTKTILIGAILTLAIGTSALAKKEKKVEKTKWENVDFFDKYKGKIKVTGGAKKNLARNPSFIRDYTIGNALVMKGSESNSKGSVFSEVFFGGIPQEPFQKMVEELYQQFTEGMSTAGLTITDGDELLKSDWAVKKSGDRGAWVGKTGNKPIPVKASIMDAVVPGYGVFGVKEAVNFRPENKNVYMTNKKVYGTFYQNLSVKSGVNLIAVYYNITFAAFDGGRGYKTSRLETKPVLSIQPTVVIDGVSITFGDLPIWGNNDWSLGLTQTNLNKLEYFGLATSGDYALQADPDKYIAEVKAIISNFQNDLIQALKEKM